MAIDSGRPEVAPRLYLTAIVMRVEFVTVPILRKTTFTGMKLPGVTRWGTRTLTCQTPIKPGASPD